MTVLAQALAGVVLALALADGLARRVAGLLTLAALRGVLAALALAAEGLLLAAGLVGLGTAGMVVLVWIRPDAFSPNPGPASDPPPVLLPPLPWQAWVLTLFTAGLALGAGAPGLPLAILLSGLLSLLVCPVMPVPVLALTTMQLGIALLLPTQISPGWLATGAACLPLAAGVIALRGWFIHGSGASLGASLGPSLGQGFGQGRRRRPTAGGQVE